jgi:hypothetical protein
MTPESPLPKTPMLVPSLHGYLIRSAEPAAATISHLSQILALRTPRLGQRRYGLCSPSASRRAPNQPGASQSVTGWPLKGDGPDQVRADGQAHPAQPTNQISGIAAPYPARLAAADRSCPRTRKVHPGPFGTFIIPNGRGVTVPADAAGWPGHEVPNRIWMLSGSKVSSDCVQVRPGQW